MFESCDDDFASVDLDCCDFRVCASRGESRAFALFETAAEFNGLRRTLSHIDIGEFHRHSVGFVFDVAKQDVRIDDSGAHLSFVLRVKIHESRAEVAECLPEVVVEFLSAQVRV